MASPEERADVAAKIAIVGAGHVGVTIAYACLIRGTGKTIALYDRNRTKVAAEVLDLRHGLEFVRMANIEGSNDVEVCRDADVLVFTVGATPDPAGTRLDLARDNVAICRELLPSLLEVAPNAVLVVVANPVDVLAYAALRLLGLPPNRVIGTGTLLDSSRFRGLIARHCGVAVQSVHAYIAGEHGDSEVPLWSSATIGSVPVLQWADPKLPPLTAPERERIFSEVVQAGRRIHRGKGYTNYAVALAATRIIEAVIYDEHEVLPVSSLLADYAGVRDVCLSVPSIVGRGGVLRPLLVPLSDEERGALHSSAQAVRAAIDALDL